VSRQIYAQVRLDHDEARVLDEYRRQCALQHFVIWQSPLRSPLCRRTRRDR
jgi:hypothetical protein